MEFFNAFFLPFVFVTYCYVHDQGVGFNSIMAMALNGIILMEGSFLWFGISRQITNSKADNFFTAFRNLKRGNLILIALTIVAMLTYPFSSSFDRVGAIAFFSLAVLEHINYFEYQLMYDNKSDLAYLRRFGIKKSKLKTLLTRNK